LVLGTTVPLVLFAGSALYKMARDARAVRDQGQADTVRALALAVDGEVRAWKAVVTALAESQSLRPDRLAEFYEESRQVAAPHDGWVVLTVASGDQLINTLRPYGAPLSKTSSPETINAVFRDGQPIVSDVFYGQNAQRYLVSVAVPVLRSGKVIYCLTLNFTPQRLSRILQSQQLSPTWTASINDRQGRVVARSQQIEQRIGKPTVPWLIEAMRAAQQGIATGPLTDGRVGQVAFLRLQEVPWTVMMSIPVAEIPTDRPVQWFALLGLLLGLAALGITLSVSRRITAPIARLAASATVLVRGAAPDLGGPLAVRELEELHQSLVTASVTAQALQREQERAAVSEERAKAAAIAAQASHEHAQALEASEERFRTLFESATDAILVTDPTGVGRVLAVNPAACRLFGYAEAEFVGLTREAIVDTTDTQVAPMLDARERSGQTNAELTYKRKDGTRFPGELTSSLIDSPGENRTAVAIIRDITGRRRAEEEIRSLARFPAENPNPVFRLDHDGIILFVNAAGAAVLGEWKCSTGDRAPDPWPATIRDALAMASERVIDLECGCRWYSFFVAPVPESRYVNLYASDITARKQAEEALRKANDALESRVRERTAEVSEAVRTLERQARQLRILAAELTLTEQRERRRLAEALHDGLQQLLVAARVRAYMIGRSNDPEVREGCQEMVALLQEALAEARTLTEEISPPTLQKGGLLPTLEWLTRWVGEKHQLTVCLRPPAAPLPPLAEDLSVLLYQAVRELLLNTVKYAQVAEAEVTLTHQEETLTLTVSDAGIGFDPTRLRVEGGIEGGFGLFGIRERLELLGGRLEIESRPGRGSRFSLVAPLRPVAEAAPAARPPAIPAIVPDGVDAGCRTRVLVVDDHALVRRGFVTLLAGEPDLEVVGEAADGKMAIELARDVAPDIILMDINMPVMNGIEATRAIHAEFPMARVVGLSALDAAEQSDAMRAAGAVACLSKIDSAEALLAAIRAGDAPTT
jgi:PAS domain S-box-containing protein